MPWTQERDMTTVILALHRKPAVREAMGWANSTLYQKIKDGLFVPPVKIGPRSSGWPGDEVAAVQGAIIAGADDDELRTLVAKLVAKRSALRQSA